MPKTVLLIDDDADTLAYMSTILLRNGYKTLTAGDGREGRQILEEHRPDLVLLDIMMPRQSGIQFLTDIKNHPEFGGIPIIIITGLGQMTGVDMQKYTSDKPGRDSIWPESFMEKPVKPDKLLKAVKQALPD